MYPAAIVPNGPFWYLGLKVQIIKEQFPEPSQIKLDKPLKIVAPNISRLGWLAKTLKNNF